MGRHRGRDDAGRARRRRQRRAQRAARIRAAAAAVLQAGGARRWSSSGAFWRWTPKCATACARARCAHHRAGAFHAGGQHLSRPALDLSLLAKREDGRRSARRGRSHVGDGARHRGRQRFGRRAGVAAGAGRAAAGARTRRQRRRNQAADGSAARRARQIHAGAGRGDAQEPAGAASARPQCARNPPAGSAQHARQAGEPGAVRQQGCGAAMLEQLQQCWRTCRLARPGQQGDDGTTTCRRSTNSAT